MDPELDNTRQIADKELEQPEWDGGINVPKDPAAIAPELMLIGTVVEGNYKIVDVLGKGGMSSVYLAHHQLINRNFAVKMLHPHLIADTSSHKRFQQEAQAVSGLDHPNIVRVSGFGVTADGQPYIIMDYLQGKPLSESIRGRKLNVQQVLHIFVQTCKAIGHAHSKGIVHRDLKPSNIMLVTYDGDEHFVKLVDFGIAKLLPQEGEAVHRLTQTGEIFGSPLYMCPEQWLGKGVDFRSDVYSLGCVLYEALCNRPPIYAENVFETMNRHLTELPQPMSIEGAQPALLERLESIVFKALEKEPEKRWQSMEEFAQALSSIEEELRGGAVIGRSITARVDRQRRKFKKAVSDKWKPRYTLIVALLLPVAFLVGGWCLIDTASLSKGPVLADLPWPPEVTRPDTRTPPSDVDDRLRNSFHLIHLKEIANANDYEELRDEWKRRAQKCERWGILSEAIASRLKARTYEKMANTSSTDDYCKETEALVEDYILEGTRESYEKADSLLGEVINVRDHNDYENPRTTVIAGDVKMRLGEESQAEGYYKQALAILSHESIHQRMFESESLELALIHCKLGDIQRHAGDAYDAQVAKAPDKAAKEYSIKQALIQYQQAANRYGQALNILLDMQETLKSETEKTALAAKVKQVIYHCSANLAFCEQRMGTKDQEALRHYAMALPGAESTDRNDWADSVLSNYAVLLWQTNHFLEALQIRDRARQRHKS